MADSEEAKAPQGDGSKKKGPPANIPPPRPKLSKAERRALQEQQRAAKAARQGTGQHSANDKANVPIKSSTAPTDKKPSTSKSEPLAPAAKKEPLVTKNQTANNILVGHLTLAPPVSVTFDTGAVLRAKTNPDLPDAVVRLGYLYATGQIRGGNARCRAMLECYKTILVSNPDAPDVMIKSAFQFWTTQCRAHSITMGNAFTFLKAALASLMQQQDDSKIRETLCEMIETYKQERIEYADKAIADIACQKLLANPDEVILTFGYSEAVAQVLEQANLKRVIIVDSKPLSEGLYMYDSLSSKVTPEYIDISALTYVLPEVDKVLLGASALQTDGSVMGRIGTSVVALAAHAHHIPVLICAETYKISNRGIPLESLTHNEVLEEVKDDSDGATSSLQLLYDLTPAKRISGIVTELGLVPPSSVAVLLREMNPQEFKSGATAQPISSR